MSIYHRISSGDYELNGVALSQFKIEFNELPTLPDEDWQDF
jgi:hypothetical protein